MPMSFPDMASLKRAAEMWKFRKPNEDETEAEFREALADYVHSRDMIEAMEIRTSKGWDQWDDGEKNESLRRAAWQGPTGTLKVIDERQGSKTG